MTETKLFGLTPDDLVERVTDVLSVEDFDEFWVVHSHACNSVEVWLDPPRIEVEVDLRTDEMTEAAEVQGDLDDIRSTYDSIVLDHLRPQGFSLTGEVEVHEFPEKGGKDIAVSFRLSRTITSAEDLIQALGSLAHTDLRIDLATRK
jgi:hypothetical protein